MLEGLSSLLDMIERNGAVIVFAIISGFLNVRLFTQIASGKLVPRRILDDIEEDRDRLQAILDKERERFMEPMLDTLKRQKNEEGEKT